MKILQKKFTFNWNPVEVVQLIFLFKLQNFGYWNIQIEIEEILGWIDIADIIVNVRKCYQDLNVIHLC